MFTHSCSLASSRCTDVLPAFKPSTLRGVQTTRWHSFTSLDQGWRHCVPRPSGDTAHNIFCGDTAGSTNGRFFFPPIISFSFGEWPCNLDALDSSCSIWGNFRIVVNWPKCLYLSWYCNWLVTMFNFDFRPLTRNCRKKVIRCSTIAINPRQIGEQQVRPRVKCVCVKERKCLKSQLPARRKKSSTSWGKLRGLQPCYRKWNFRE